MDSGLLQGFLGALTPDTLWYCFLGVLLGTGVGVLPGLGSGATTAILLPLTVYLSPKDAIVMLAGIYYGSMYGGSTTSILMNVPGEAASVVTALDGFQMTKQGRAGQALAIAAIGSFVAGTGGVILLSFIGPTLADLALKFGAPEYFGLVAFSLTALLSLTGGSVLKGLTVGMAGMLVASVGLDPMSGRQRLVFGFPELMSGFDLIPVLMGLFGVAEVLASAEEGIVSIYSGALGRLLPRGEELRKGIVASLRATGLGLGLGLLPGMLPSVVSFISYDLERRFSRHPERFGTGVIEGVAAPEAANNAVAQAGFIPLLSLGIPTSPVLAILLAAFMMYGLQPGPLLFSQHPDLAWSIIGSMYVGNVMLLVLNLPLVGLWARFSRVPYKFLGPFILGVCIVGAYSIRNSMFDVWSAILFGLVGYAMKARNWPAAPLILGFILGPMLERYLRGSLQMSGGSAEIFLNRPIAAGFLLLTVLVLAMSRRLLATGKA